MNNFYQQVYAVVRRIPPGRITTYGRIAQMLGAPRAARAVGYALNALSDSQAPDVPWQRVINGQGRISIVNRQVSAAEQAQLLQNEGIAVSEDLRIDLEKYLWQGLHWAEVEQILNPAGNK